MHRHNLLRSLHRPGEEQVICPSITCVESKPTSDDSAPRSSLDDVSPGVMFLGQLARLNMDEEGQAKCLAGYLGVSEIEITVKNVVCENHLFVFAVVRVASLED